MTRRSKPRSAQANKYDKIFKENIEAVVPGLIANLLHIHAITTEEIPDDVQHTKERSPDVLKRITDVHGQTFILQLEFQVADEPEMVYRMADYYLMLERRYGLPVEQYVLFVGPGQPAMPTQLRRKRLQFEFPLIAFSQLDYELFLHSEKPEEVILDILADFRQKNPAVVVRQLIERIEETAQGDFSVKRYFQQLRVLAHLRNLEAQIDQTMDSIAEYINEERNVLYVRGERKAKLKIVGNLLKNTKLTPEQIAKNAEVSVDFVLEVKAGMLERH